MKVGSAERLHRCRRIQPRCADALSTVKGRQGTAEALYALIFVLQTDAALAFGLIAAVDGEIAAIVIVAADLTRN
jgi:hypothetical protein